MKRLLLNLLVLAAFALMGGTSAVWAQTTATIGMTQTIPEGSTTAEKLAFPTTDHVTCTPVYGSDLNYYVDILPDHFRSTDNVYYYFYSEWYIPTGVSSTGTYIGHNIGYTLSIDEGYIMSLNRIEARIFGERNTTYEGYGIYLSYTWYAEILDGEGTVLYKSDEQTMQTNENNTLSAQLDLTELTETTGDITVQIWINPSTSGVNVTIERLTVDAEVKRIPKSHILTTEDTDFYGLYLDYASAIPEGVTAYTGSLNEDENLLTLTRVEGGVIPANTAVLVKSEEPGDYDFTDADDTDPIEGNDLLGVTEETSLSTLIEGIDKTVLTLGMKDGEIGFRQPAGETIGANKVYLLVGPTFSAKGVTLSFGDDVTGISDVTAWRTDGNAPLFNLAGQRVAEGTKGLLIRNGKKFINK